ncbi:Ger(x)C family spore germination protein [Radiobacillus sp. PE A8.2]|uniref:Ger(x)C family spore germination protein n=1 Tax=Radiobacillus sp. PE A8.2 TaxID=3380349 RepID=UPI00388E0E0E
MIVNKLCCIVVLVIFLTGCSDQRIVEQAGFINALGLDLFNKEEYEKNRTLHVTASIPQVDPDAQKKREVISTDAKIDKEAMLNLARKTNRIIASGKIKVILFGKDLAEYGIREDIDTFARDPIFGRQIKIAVVEGTASEIMKPDFPEKPRSSIYIDELLEKETKMNSIPEATLFQFQRDINDKGRDPSAPILKLVEQEVMVDGIALFRDDQYVTKLEPYLSRYFFFLNGDFSAGSINLKFEEEGKNEPVQLMFSSLKNARDISATYNNKDDITVDIVVRVEGSPLEYNGSKDLSKPEDQKFLEQKIEQHVKKVSDDIIKMLQDNKVDSLGLGRYVRNKMSFQEWEQMNWYDEVYPNVKVNVDVQAKVKNYGIKSN